MIAFEKTVRYSSREKRAGHVMVSHREHQDKRQRGKKLWTGAFLCFQREGTGKAR